MFFYHGGFFQREAAWQCYEPPWRHDKDHKLVMLAEEDPDKVGTLEDSSWNVAGRGGGRRGIQGRRGRHSGTVQATKQLTELIESYPPGHDGYFSSKKEQRKNIMFVVVARRRVVDVCNALCLRS